MTLESRISELARAAKPTVAIIGLGGAGCNIVSWITQKEILGSKIIAADTDAAHLLGAKADAKILLGEKAYQGKGSGGFAERGTEAARESLKEIRQELAGSNLVFIIAGMGGGSGTGAAPVVAEAVRGVKVTVGPPFYNQVMIPFGLILLLITGICPLIAWRRASWANLKRNFLPPFALVVVATGILAVFGIRRPLVLITFSFLLFVTATIFSEFYRGTRARHQMMGGGFASAFGGLVRRNRRRYGGYIVHLGILLLVLAIAGEAFRIEREAHLKTGETIEIGRYRLRYDGPVAFERGDTSVVGARITVSNAGKPLGVLVPEKRFHADSEQPHTMAAIFSTLKEDLYLILASIDEQGIAIRALINPLMVWMWIGSYVIGFGTVIVMWPERKHREAARG